METYSQRILKGGRLVAWQRFARFRAAAEAIRRVQPALPVDKLLDIGAADGIGLPFLKPLAREVLSVNYYENHTQQFREAHPTEPVLTADARALPLPDASFDICTSFETLNCVPGRPDRIKCIQEICRVLKPSGWFVGSIPLEVGYPALLKYLARALTGKSTRGMTFGMMLRHWFYRWFDVENLSGGCHVGFNAHQFVDDMQPYFGIVQTRTIPLPLLLPMNLLVVARKK